MIAAPFQQQLSIVIPVHDEQACIPLLIEEIKKAIPTVIHYEIIVVDDNSNDNTDLIIKNTDSLLSLIDDVDFKLDNFIRETERNFRNVTNDLEDLSDEFRTNSRRTKQKLADLEQARDQLIKDLKEVRALPSIIKGIQKMKEEAAKEAQK